MKRILWVVEMKLEGTWVPCESGQITRQESREKDLRPIKELYPDGKFRIRKYVPLEEK